MNNYQPPCYTIEEACSMLAITKTELKHAVQMEQIKPVLYIAGKKMLIFSREARDKWVGHAVIRYRGHYSAHKNVITALIDGQEKNIGQGSGRILDQAGIEQISHTYPFKTPRPFGTLVDWQTIDENAAHICQQSATPLPNEVETVAGFLKSLLSTLTTVKVNQGQPPKTTTQKTVVPHHDKVYELNFKINSLIKPEAIRIPTSEIEAFKRSLALPSTTIGSLGLPTKSNNRSNQLHELVSRILKTNPKLPAKLIWQVLKEDILKDEPLFDTDHILVAIDANGLTWESRNGNEQHLKWASFPPLVSRAREK